MVSKSDICQYSLLPPCNEPFPLGKDNVVPPPYIPTAASFVFAGK